MNNKILYSIILFLSYTSVVFGQVIVNPDSVWEHVKEKICLDVNAVDVYYSKAELDSGFIIKDVVKEEIVSENNSFFFFIDESPLSNWEHPCKYIFVNPINGDCKVINRNRPPVNIELSPLFHIDRAKMASKKQTKQLIGSAITPLVSLTDYAVIISGGMNPNYNYERYWNDCSEMYKTLIYKYGYQKDHVYVLMADGQSPGLDMHLNNGDFISSPLDLDADGTIDINMAATKVNIQQVFTDLGNILNEDNHLFVFCTDHGGLLYGNVAYMCLWNNSLMYDYEFSHELDKVSAGRKTIVMEQCNSGGFIDNIQATNSVISTACAYNESSNATSDMLYDEFAYNWISAVSKQTPSGNNIFSDYNLDGNVSIEEAFLYAQNNNLKNETPQYSSIPSDIGSRFSLSTPLSISGPTVVHDSAHYFVEGVPSGFEVEWSVANLNRAPYPVLSVNSSDNNLCTIHNYYHYPFNSTIIATIKRNGETITTLQKEFCQEGDNIDVYYSQETCTYLGVQHPVIEENYMNSNRTYFIHQGCRVRIRSSRMKFHKVSYSGATPDLWVRDGEDAYMFVLSNQTGGIPFYVTFENDACATHRYLFFSIGYNGNINSNKSLSIKAQNGILNVEVTEMGTDYLAISDIGCKEDSSENIVNRRKWISEVKDEMRVEIYSGRTGLKLVDIKCKGSSYSLDTHGLDPGIYVVRVMKDGEVLSGKIHIH